MNFSISPINFAGSRNQSAQEITRMVLQGKNGKLQQFRIATKPPLNITSIEQYEKGELVQRYSNKKGFSNDRLLDITERIQESIQDGIDFFTEMFKAILKPL